MTDISVLFTEILPILSPASALPEEHDSSTSLKEAIDAYEEETIKRTAPAVLTSRRACSEAHDYKRIKGQSPLISRRSMVRQESKRGDQNNNGCCHHPSLDGLGML